MIIDERDEEVLKILQDSKQHCSAERKLWKQERLHKGRGFEWSMWCLFICSCFLLSPKMKEIFPTQFNVHSFNFTSMMSFNSHGKCHGVCVIPFAHKKA